MFSWSEEQLQPLEGCASYWRTHATRGELDAICENLLPRLRQSYAAAHEAFPADAFAPSMWTWARSVVETRAMALPEALSDALPQGTLVLVPIVDMANHAPRAMCHLEVMCDRDRGGLCVRTRQAARAGEQLCLSYGPLTAEQLLEHHGIVDATPPPPPLGASLQGRGEEAGAAACGDHVPEGSVPDGSTRAGPPLVVELTVAPGAALEEDASLLGTVLLVMQHLSLELEGQLVEPPLAPGEADTWHNLEATRPAPTVTRSRVVPPKLVASARLLCLRSNAELEALPVSDAENAPLSPANEHAALAMLRAACDDLRWEPQELRAALGDAQERDTDERDDAGARASGPAAKRLKPSDEHVLMRSHAARAFALRRQRVLDHAIAELDVMAQGVGE